MKKTTSHHVKYMCIALLSFFLLGCTDSYYYVTPHPLVQANASTIGHGKTIELVVNDGRADKMVSTVHGAIPGGPKNHLMLANDAMQSIYASAKEGLVSQAFDVSKQHESTTLTITLTQLHQDIITVAYNLAPPRRVLQSTLEVRAVRSGVVYQKSYKAEQNISIYHNSVLDRVLTQNLNEVFSDRKLMDFLAK